MKDDDLDNIILSEAEYIDREESISGWTLLWLLGLAVFVAVVFGVVGASRGASPASELAAAVADLQRLSPSEAATTRYLTLYGVPISKRPELTKVVSYTLNAVSRSRYIKRPDQISRTLLRFNVAWYTQTEKDREEWVNAWERTGLDESYWSIKTEAVTADDGKQKTVTVPGGWIGLDNYSLAKTRALTSFPVMRADYFVVAASQPPRYYEYLGIPPKQADFLKLIGVDKAVIERLRANSAANLIRSNVTHKNRRITAANSPLGRLYLTLDMNQVSADRDPFRRPIDDGDFKLKNDAEEIFTTAPNGLWWTALYDANGNRQDAVPDAVAKDDHGDGIVRPFVSCIRCHQESGLRPFRDDQGKLLSYAPGKPGLYSYRPELVQRALELYDLPRISQAMDYDRQVYDVAVERACNLTAPALAQALTNVVQNYLYDKVTPTYAAGEMGLRNLDSLRQSNDPIVLLLLEGEPVLRGQWESSFAGSMQLAYGLRPPAAKPAAAQPAAVVPVRQEQPTYKAQRPRFTFDQTGQSRDGLTRIEVVGLNDGERVKLHLWWEPHPDARTFSWPERSAGKRRRIDYDIIASDGALLHSSWFTSVGGTEQQLTVSRN